MKKILIVTIVFFLTFTVKAQNEKKVYETDIFSIKYPVEWELTTETDNQALFYIKSPLDSDTDEFSENINLITQNLEGMKISLDFYVKENIKGIATIPNGKVLSNKREKRGNEEYHILVFKGRMNNLDLKIQQVYAIKNEVAYILTFTTTEEKYEQFEEIGTEILNSFKLKN